MRTIRAFRKVTFRSSLLLVFVSSFILPPSAVPQGSLTPPGAPTPTMKKLDEIEPRTNLQATPLPPGVTTDGNWEFIINQPGSYYLSANLGVTKPNGIEINAEGVTLDLHGFQISRASGSGGSGILLNTASHRASISNGSVTGFGAGILSFSSGARACSFRDLTVGSCTSVGIQVGPGSVLEACRVHDSSGTDGIWAQAGSTLVNCTVFLNTTTRCFNVVGCTLVSCTLSANTGTHGIVAGNSALINCAAYGNTATYGIYAYTASTLRNCFAYDTESADPTSAGIATGNGCTITDSTASSNLTAYGIYAFGQSVINGCSADNNTATYGIYATAGSSLTNCSASNNTATYGIYAHTGSTLTNCSARSNTSAATFSAGIGTGDGCTIAHCTASNNVSTAGTPTSTTGMGFSLGADTIQNCTASFNKGDGIRISNDTLVRDSTCVANGSSGDGAGIHATSSDNRIEGNNVTDNDRGIDVDQAGNVIIKNSASGNDPTNDSITTSSRTMCMERLSIGLLPPPLPSPEIAERLLSQQPIRGPILPTELDRDRRPRQVNALLRCFRPNLFRPVI